MEQLKVIDSPAATVFKVELKIVGISKPAQNKMIFWVNVMKINTTLVGH